MDKWLRILYFEKSYHEDAHIPNEFNTHPALVATKIEFSKATEEMVNFWGKRLSTKCG